MVELIRIKSSEEISKVSKLAMEIMKEHYDPIVGSEVNDHMLKNFNLSRVLRRRWKTARNTILSMRTAST